MSAIRKAGFLSTLVMIAVSSAPGTGSVEFKVLNRWGMAHNYKMLHFRLDRASPDLAPDLASAFHNLAAFNIPYGNYEYELVPLPGDFSEERLVGTLSVSRSQMHVTRVLETTDSIGHRAQVQVAGTLQPRPKGREAVWVILENVYGGFRDESTVDDRGDFQFHNISGNNAIIVCAGSEVLFVGRLSVKPDETVNYLRIHLDTGRVDAEFRKF